VQNILVQTTKFPHLPEGDLERNNGSPGSAFAIWLSQKLSAMGLSCDEVSQEDYGWGFWIKSKEHTIWICVSYAADEDEDGNAIAKPQSEPADWFVSVNFEDPMLLLKPWQWGRFKTGGDEQRKIASLLLDALQAEPEITVVRIE
jgi:hypothetical protein